MNKKPAASDSNHEKKRGNIFACHEIQICNQKFDHFIHPFSDNDGTPLSPVVSIRFNRTAT